MTAIINVKFRGETFTSQLSAAEGTPAYIIADEAYKLALLFAETRVLAECGHPIPLAELGEILREIDYNCGIQHENGNFTLIEDTEA